MPTYHVAVDVEEPHSLNVETYNCVVTVPTGKDAAEMVALRQIGKNFPERRISIRHCRPLKSRWRPLGSFAP